MSEHRYDIDISKSCVDPNPFMVERQDPDNFTRFQTRERCALEIAAYVFNYFTICSRSRQYFAMSNFDHNCVSKRYLLNKMVDPTIHFFV